MKLQRNRIYELVLGNTKTGEGVLISELQVRFDVTKSSDNKRKANGAVIEVFNLSDATLKKFEKEYLRVELRVGYSDVGLTTILIGNATETKTVTNGSDRVTQIQVGEAYVQLNEEIIRGVAPAGTKLKDFLNEVVGKMPGVSKGAFTGVNLESELTYGYPYSGTPREVLNDLAETYRLEWRVDRDVLSVTDEAGLADPDKKKAFVLNENTGLIDIPFYTSGKQSMLKKDPKRRQGVQFKCLLNPKIIPGSIVRLESKLITGWYKVKTARYFGGYDDNEFYADCFCDIITEEDLTNAR